MGNRSMGWDPGKDGVKGGGGPSGGWKMAGNLNILRQPVNQVISS